jgi:hypothetical protein
MKGRWQKDIPERRGQYWAATRDGHLAGPYHVIPAEGTWVSAEFMSTGPWQGWWWSEPIPEPPKPPAWETT